MLQKYLLSLMLLILGSRAFHTPTVQRSSTKLAASFFQNMFSTDSNGEYVIGVTGASGLVGTALIDELSSRETINGRSFRVVPLSRSPQAENSWNPSGSTPNEILPNADSYDAVVHLAGENVATGLGPLGFIGLRPWTDAKKKEILDSRTGPTQAIAKALQGNKQKQTLITASGIGVYGNEFIGDALPAADESSDTKSAPGFLAEVSRAWEAASASPGNRVVNLRLGVVLSTKGGALAKLYPIFFLGGGGNVGSGQQYFSFVSARDVARGIVHSLETPSLQGPVNLNAPIPCTNAEFTSALGKAINRPTILPFPGFAVSLLFGEMGEEMLLGGVRCVPSKLEQSGFKFLHPTVEAAIKSAVDEKTI